VSPTPASPTPASSTPANSTPAKSFAALSAALTGFREADLWGTGQVEPYLSELLKTVGEEIVARLLAAGDQALASPDPTQALKQLVMDDEDLGPVAHSLIVMWYLGQWSPLPAAWRNRNGANPLDMARVISADAYTAGLVWTAIGAHPMGAKPGGFGSWANPPSDPAAAIPRADHE
jgi:hypothetical protein